MTNPEYQKTVDLPVDLPRGIRPLTAECFVNWLIEYKGLPEASRENVIDNLKNDYQRVELQGALKQAMAYPLCIHKLLALRKEEMRSRRDTDFLLPKFLEAMNDIGRYGFEKYGDFSFHVRAAKGDNSRGDHPRTEAIAIAEHASDHFCAYLAGETHDHFLTRRHQLAAVAFNAMMEFYFAGLDGEL